MGIGQMIGNPVHVSSTWSLHTPIEQLALPLNIHYRTNQQSQDGVYARIGEFDVVCVTDATTPFVASASFSGRKPGYMFHVGEHGIGYYTDREQSHPTRFCTFWKWSWDVATVSWSVFFSSVEWDQTRRLFFLESTFIVLNQAWATRPQCLCNLKRA